jgi:hypothetical protein
MRLRAGIGMALLALAGCAHRPERLILEVDDFRVEIVKKDAPRGE